MRDSEMGWWEEHGLWNLIHDLEKSQLSTELSESSFVKLL